MISWSARRRAAWSSRRSRVRPAAPRRTRRWRTAAPTVCWSTVDPVVVVVAAAAPRCEVERVGVVAAAGQPRAGRRAASAAGSDPAEVVVVVVLVDREQRVALEQELLAPVAERSDRRVVAVEHERRGHVAHAVAEQLEPPAEVDVLEEHEVALVEPADRAGTTSARTTIAAPDGEQDVGLAVVARGRRARRRASLKPCP